MGKVPVEAKRNVTLIGHHGSGKTHLVDSLLFNVGMIDRTGIFVTDNEEIEKERKATFSLGVTGLEYKNTRINIVDTPGMPDFHAETVNGIYASENILLVLNATAGMEIQSERFGAVAKELSKGIIVFFNMMDKDRAEYEAALSDIKETFERSPVLLQLPIGTAAEFKGVIDLIEGKAYIYDNGKPQVQELPDDLKDQYEEARTRMIEDIVETDEELMEKYFEGEEITTEEIKRALKTAYINNQIIPVLFGSALKNIGTDRLLETIVDLGKNPAEGGKWPAQLQSGEEIEISPVENEPFAGYIFKSVVDPFVGKLTFIKIISGILKPGDSIVVVDEESTEKVSHILAPNGTKDIELEEASVGDIIKLAKLKKSAVGDTVTHKDRQLKVKLLNWPEPMISKSIHPKSKTDIDKISNGLSRLSESDPTFNWEYDPETGETVISGLGSLHLDIMIDRLKRLFSVDVEVGKPKIAYRETIRKKVVAEYKHKKQTGGHGQYGHVQIEIEPLERGAGFEFVDKIVGGVIPKNYIPAVEKGVKEAMKKGVLAGYPVVDVKVTLVYGSYHEVDSSDMSFQIAASQAFKKGMAEANPVILEPIMDVEIFVPDDNAGDVMGEVTSRRGRPMGMETLGKGTTKVLAQVPLAEMLDFANKLNSITSGRGYFTMKFAGYQETPSDVQQKVIVEREREQENG
ncbi:MULTISPECIES: elongation factor G [Kosmotoga]|uniref:Elongation factor G n=1 Tax=Kosmotoga olearia (strain ATCC BAA-1733 / DSM 21960 / TBF 19.5.1) TaxID=521045 RepID=C5CET5_KOSOT|nr:MULTISPECIES: elongation factor G [Kosmotoga]ACR80265.1 translation elongation factor G [Kosmotoga olearia TBF 19.5.1]MDI3523451.1 elongation factor [Kosmotoga sp.]MDK2953006.1 elongation factor [Kosmotoga sp.]OAA20203.1 elongation factor G [Kosmotoga sp. DU53]